MKKQTKYFAVLSAAAIMALTPAFSGLDHTGRVLAASYGWTEENGQLAYYDEDGYLTTDSWRKNGDDWYYLDEEGSIARNQKIDDYYVGEDGKMVKNTWVELQNEDEMDSPETPASYWYYFDKNGKSVISKWIKLNENWYYFNESGHMATGKTVIDGAVYYLGGETDGRMKTGWVKLEENASSPGASESWHYFNSDGRMVDRRRLLYLHRREDADGLGEDAGNRGFHRQQRRLRLHCGLSVLWKGRRRKTCRGMADHGRDPGDPSDRRDLYLLF